MVSIEKRTRIHGALWRHAEKFKDVSKLNYCECTYTENEDNSLYKFCYHLLNKAINSNICPFCNTLMIRVRTTFGGEYLDDDADFGTLGCPGCLWSCSRMMGDCAAQGIMIENIDILKPFDISTSEENILWIVMELLKDWDKVNEIEPLKLEELVYNISRSLFDCEVKWVGGTGDGGIDIFALISDNPLAIQVKRRKNRKSAEGVSVIREFGGALIENNLRKGVFVSTADHYTRGAKSSVEKIIKNSHIESIQLVDSRKLCDIFELIWDSAF